MVKKRMKKRDSERERNIPICERRGRGRGDEGERRGLMKRERDQRRNKTPNLEDAGRSR